MPRSTPSPATVPALAVSQGEPASPTRRAALRGAGAVLAGVALPPALLAMGGDSRAEDSPALRYAHSEKALRLAMMLSSTGMSPMLRP